MNHGISVIEVREQRAEALAAKARAEHELKDALAQIAVLVVEPEVAPGQLTDGPGQVPPGQRKDDGVGADEDAWVPPGEFRYMDDRTPMRIRYSLRATGMHLVAPKPGRVEAIWTAAGTG